MEAAEREGSQRVEALSYQLSLQTHLRSGVISAIPAANQLSGRGLTDVDVTPVAAY